MKKRLITGIVMLIVLVPLLIIQSLLPVLLVAGGIFVAIGAWEMVRMYDKGKKLPIVIKVIIILTSLLTYLGGMVIWSTLTEEFAITQQNGHVLVVDFKIGFAMLLISIVTQLSLLVFYKDFDALDIGKTIATSFYVGFGVSSLIALRIMGVRFVVYLFLITILTDVFAYVYGMLFGKHKMIERISPKKTWEGAIGGTIVATVAATLFAYLYGDLFNDATYKTIFHGFSNVVTMDKTALFIVIFFVTFLTSIAGQIGDLVASRLKRTYDVKDFSNIFPGHGGFLDRFDSSIVASMALLALFLIVSSIV